jgi:hypothetical protein
MRERKRERGERGVRFSIGANVSCCDFTMIIVWFVYGLICRGVSTHHVATNHSNYAIAIILFPSCGVWDCMLLNKQLNQPHKAPLVILKCSVCHIL